MELFILVAVIIGALATVDCKEKRKKKVDIEVERV